MRFHKLELCNVNSLAGEHVIDFDAVTGGAGMFLIHGPTGAGKSTILDAICLALFGKTPRLDDVGKQGIDGVDVNASDENPARVMTLGAGLCHARLELSVADEQGQRARYRAKWSVWRAHKQPDGTFREPMRTLEQLVGNEWKTLVASSIQKEYAGPFSQMLCKLSFEDFQRTILLAQFKFRQFLDADVDARTKILERMTDSKRFRAIGALAADERRCADEAVARAQAGLDGLAILGPDERAALEQSLASDRATIAMTRARLKQLQQATDFWEALGDARARSAAAQAALSAVASKRESSRALLEALAENERLAPAREARAVAIQKDGAAAQHHERLQATRRAEADAVARLQEAEQLRDAAIAAHEAAVADRAAQLPAIEAAAHAWRVAKTERDAAADAATTAAQEAHELEQRRATVAGRKASLDDLTGLRAACDERLAGIPAAALLLEAAGSVVALAASVGATAQAAARDNALCDAARKAAADHATGRAGLATAAGDKASATVDAGTLVAEREAALRAATSGVAFDDAVQRADGERDALDATLMRLDALARAARQDDKLAAELAAIDRHADALAKAVVDALAAVDDARQRERDAVAVRDDARAGLRTSEALVAVLKHRDVLRDGEACPVCGSEDHPWVASPERAPKLDDELARHAVLVARADDAEAGVARAAGRRSDAEVATGKAEATLAEVRRERAQRHDEHAVARAERAARARDAGIDVDGTPAAVDAAMADARGRREALVQRLASLRALDLDVRVAREREQQAAGARAAAERALQEHDGKATLLLERATIAVAQAAERRREADDARAALARRLAELEVDTADVEAGAQQVASRVKRVRELTEERQRVDERLRDLEPQIAAAETALAETQSRHDVAQRKADATAARATAAEATARGLLAGADPEAERARLDGAVADRRAAEAAARERHATATTNAATTATLAAEHDAAAREAAALAAHAVAALTGTLATLGIGSVDELDARMLPSERHAEATACRDALDEKEQAARTLHAAAESDLAAVSSTRPDDEPADAVASERLSVLATASAETNAALEALLQSTAVKDTRIASDDAARVAAAGRAEALAMAKAERDEWDIVHKLIGLGDGARFATVVQALQLQQVLLHANENLARFMPRYALEQVFHKEAGPLLDFRVVDKDQQGGVRSIQSLSGGESFVVSLALALGLAAIRSSRLRIETLLIDEGFGSLDPATLALAHQALQSLQGAAGVQIGIISHVGTLKELIAAQIVVEPTGAGASRIRHGDAQRGSDGGPDGDPDGDPDDASTGRPAA